MSYVSEQVIIQNSEANEARLVVFEARLNGFFELIETKFGEQNAQINEINGKIPHMIEKIQSSSDRHDAQTVLMEEIRTGFPQRLQQIIDESHNFVTERSKSVQEMTQSISDGLRHLNAALVQTQADVKRLDERDHGGHGGSESGPRSLINTKNFELKKYDPDRDSKAVWEEWRDDLEEHLNALRPGIKTVLEKVARWKVEISASNFTEILNAAGLDQYHMSWTYESVNEQLYTFVKKYLLLRGKKAFTTSTTGGFEGYRRLVAEVDPVNHRTKAAMTDMITGMIAKGSSRDFKELKNRLLDLESIVKRYRQRLDEEPDESLLASVLSNLLDGKTRETFTNEHILHAYKKMKERILETALEADTRGNAMDVGSFEVDRQVPTYAISTPDNSPTKPAAGPAPVQNPGGAVPNGTNEPSLNAADGAPSSPNSGFRCFTCNELGHKSFQCPLRKGAGKGNWKGQPGKGTKGSYGGNSKGGFGKGSKGKGKKGGWSGYGKGAYSVEEPWEDYSWDEWGPSSFCGCVEEGFDDDVEEELGDVYFSDGEQDIDEPPMPPPHEAPPPPHEAPRPARRSCKSSQCSCGPAETPEPVPEPVVCKLPSGAPVTVSVAPSGIMIIDREAFLESRRVISHAPSISSKDTSENYPALPTSSSSCQPASPKDWSSEVLRSRWAAIDSKSATSIHNEKSKTVEKAKKTGSASSQDEWKVPVKWVKNKKITNPTDDTRDHVVHANQFTGLMEEESDEPICPVGEEWERLVMVLDSGAAETMCPSSMATNVSVVPGAKMKAGVRYTCAGGKKLPNLGEKRCMLTTEETGTVRGLTMQVANVQKALMSVSKAVDAGNRVVFDTDWSYIQDKRTGERTTIQRQGNLYTLEAWVKQRSDDKPAAAPFGGLGTKK